MQAETLIRGLRLKREQRLFEAARQPRQRLGALRLAQLVRIGVPEFVYVSLTGRGSAIKKHSRGLLRRIFRGDVHFDGVAVLELDRRPVAVAIPRRDGVFVRRPGLARVIAPAELLQRRVLRIQRRGLGRAGEGDAVRQKAHRRRADVGALQGEAKTTGPLRRIEIDPDQNVIRAGSRPDGKPAALRSFAHRSLLCSGWKNGNTERRSSSYIGRDRPCTVHPSVTPVATGSRLG